MRAEYQLEILRFMLQSKVGRGYLDMVDKAMFDIPEYRIVLELSQNYLKEYKSYPKRVNLLEYFDKSLAGSKEPIQQEVYSLVDKSINAAFDPFDADPLQLERELVEQAQYKASKILMEKYAPRLKGEPKVFKEMMRDMNKIVALSDKDKRKKDEPLRILADHGKISFERNKPIPTYLKQLNKMTAAGGFYSPQLIILMGAPKSFKTGTLLSLAVEFVRDGHKVYYVDGENGRRSIFNRFRQAVLDCELRDLEKPEQEQMYDQLMKRWKVMGGDFAFNFYPGQSFCADDVEEDLDMLEQEYGWVPDIICWDYPDIQLPNDKDKAKDKRIGIQHVYFDIIRVNERRGTLSFGLSQVGKNAVNKVVIDMKDFAEDFGKAANAHAAFAICRTETEMERGLARIVPVVQREGVMYQGGLNMCMVKINEARMQVVELTPDQARDELEQLIADDAKIAKALGGKSTGKGQRQQKDPVVTIPSRRMLNDD